MADLQTLENAFMKAHKAGDTKTAGVLAAEIKRMRGLQQTEQQFRKSVAMPNVNIAEAGYNALPGWQKPIQAAQDMLNLGASGMTLGFNDKAQALADKYLRGQNYDDALTRRRAQTQAARDRAGGAGVVAEIGGSMVPAVKAMKAGITATRLPRLGKYGGAAVDSGIFGGLYGAGNDESIMKNAAFGLGLGPLGVVAADVVGAVAKPFMARIRPNKATAEVMEKTMQEARQTPASIGRQLAQAQAEGQGSYAVMDALGYPGQRMARNVVRNPGEVRTDMVNFLENRQSGQGRRLQAAMNEGFGNPSTALQDIQRLEAARAATGDVNYTAARDAASNVDVTNVIRHIDSRLGRPIPPGVTDGIANDSIEGALTTARRLIAGTGGAQSMNFSRLLTVRSDLSDMANSLRQAGNRKRASTLEGVVRELDASLENASVGYRRARDQFRADSRKIEAVDTGRAAAMRGRTEDTVPAFGALTPQEQSAFRAGYADPYIADIQKSAVGVNKARPLINDATAAEFPAFAEPGRGDRLMRQIGREDTMFKTRAEALGGSKTDMNLADEAALSIIDPSVLGNVLSGNWSGAIKNAVLQAASAMAGQPQSVRERVGRILMETDPNMIRSELARSINQLNMSRAKKDALVKTLTFLGMSSVVQAQK